ncbi:MAG: HD domain-containing protein [Actinomycetes bacterium]
MTDTPFLGERFDRALLRAHELHHRQVAARYDEVPGGDRLLRAHELHHRQVRKGTQVPYVSHLLGVAALVLEHGGDEDQAIAGLLHDALEDAPGMIDGERLGEEFGGKVRRLVEACTDGDHGDALRGAEGWLSRKRAHLRHLEDVDERVLLVVAADKLHNLRSLVADVRTHGPGYLDRFNAPDRASTVWYYREMATLLARRLGGPLAAALAEAASQLGDLVGPAVERDAQPAPGAL